MACCGQQTKREEETPKTPEGFSVGTRRVYIGRQRVGLSAYDSPFDVPNIRLFPLPSPPMPTGLLARVRTTIRNFLGIS